MKTSSRVNLFLIALLFATNHVYLQAQENEEIKDIPSIQTSIEVDGLPNEPVWQQALILPLAFENSPGENIAPPVKTDVYLFHSKTHLYVAFVAEDPDPQQIRAHLTDRDDSWDDDMVGVTLDTFNQGRRTFVFGVNPLGIQIDYIGFRNGGDSGWDALWESNGSLTEDGYTVELAIPFSALSFQAGEEAQIWGLEAWRDYPRNVLHQITLLPKDRNNDCWLCQLQKIRGFQNVEPSKGIELSPTVTAQSVEKKHRTDSNLDSDERTSDLGITGRWSLNPGIVFNATINPDFSQVEADALQLNINQPFALFYEERRPFFTEYADIFKTPVNAIYTRSIRDPQWGLKLTGKSGQHTFGAYVVEDDITNIIIPGSEQSRQTTLLSSNKSGILRYSYNFGNTNSLGMLLTHRSGDSYSNTVIGADASLRLTNKDYIQAQFLASQSDYPTSLQNKFSLSEDAISDTAIDIKYEHSARDLSWWAHYRKAGKDFRADLGFVPLVDYQAITVATSYAIYAKPEESWTKIQFSAQHNFMENEEGEKLRNHSKFSASINGPYQSFLSISLNQDEQRYSSQLFTNKYILLNSSLWPTQYLQLGASAKRGSGIDFANNSSGIFLTSHHGLHWRLADTSGLI
jgi:hypothetical protein